MQIFVYTVGFVVLCLASYRIGQLFSAIRLPYITGYLFAGALVSSFGLDFIPREAAESLRFIDELSLGVIAFVAGSELYLKELRPRLRSILWTTGGIIVAGLVLIALALYLLTAYLPFAATLGPLGRVAVALLGGTVLLALSPPSTIAVIREVRARGTFTSTALSVTVLMDVVIIVLFAVSASLAGALLTGTPFSISFLAVLLLDLALATALGYGVGRGFEVLLRVRWPKAVKMVLIVGTGYGIFELAGLVKAYSAAQLPFEIYIEPLLIALIGGFYVTNYTSHRHLFDEILHDVGPVVYVAFFTLTGIALKLDLLWATLPLAMILFSVRLGGIALGAYAGSSFAGAPVRQRRLAWMAFVTQAGIALGLAREVSVQFPSLGDAFATLVIAVVVLNEVFGPLFLKAALKRAGETHVPDEAERDEVRNVVVFGLDGVTRQVSQRLQAEGWEVLLVEVGEPTERSDETVPVRTLPVLDEATLTSLITPKTDAVVALLGDDEANLLVGTIAAEQGVPRLVVRPGDLMRGVAPFQELGALIVDPASAQINVIDHAVRAPQSVALLLHQQEGRDVVQVTVSNADVDGQAVRDLRLPPDVLLLDILRRGTSIVPHGNSLIRIGDEVTLLGRAESLDRVTLKLGY